MQKSALSWWPKPSRIVGRNGHDYKSLHPTEVYLRKPDESLRDAAKRLENARLLSDLLTNPMEEKEKATS